MPCTCSCTVWRLLPLLYLFCLHLTLLFAPGAAAPALPVALQVQIMMRDPRASIGEGVVFDCWHKKARVGLLPACLPGCPPAAPPAARPPAHLPCLPALPACLPAGDVQCNQGPGGSVQRHH